MNNPPDELKFVLTYLQRAQELQAREPIVAYYCNYYSAKLAIEAGATSKESQAFLLQLLDLLEKDKANLAGNEAIGNDVVGYAHVENFALKIFVNADNEDRAGKASKKTAKTFLAASIFLELLKTFGELDPEVQQKIRYAKFKAADIIKAIKEGRTPTPGPPGGEPDDTISADLSHMNLMQSQSNMTPDSSVPIDPRFMSTEASTVPFENAYNGHSSSLLTASTVAVSPTGYQSSAHTDQPPISSSFHQSYPSHPTPYIPFEGSLPTPVSHQPPATPLVSGYDAIPPHKAQTPIAEVSGYSNALFDEQLHQTTSQAQRYAKFAISALQFEDIPTAIDNLQKALATLQPLSHQPMK